MNMKWLKSISVGLFITVVLVTTAFAQSKQHSVAKDEKNMELNVYDTMKLVTEKEFGNIHSKVIITDKKGNKRPYIINENKKNEYLILPLYAEGEEIHIKVNLNPKEYKIENTKETVYLNNRENLDQLKNILRPKYGFALPFAGSKEVENMAVEEAGMQAKTAEAAGDYSKTNAQVSGIDESDIVQTDGKNIYSISDGKINIVSTEKGKMKIRKSLSLGENVYPSELYAEKDKLTVIASSYKVSTSSYYKNGRNEVSVLVYDMKDVDNPKKIRETSQEGYYISSRKDGNMIRLITEFGLYDDTIPYLKETLAEGKTRQTDLPLDKIMVFPGYYQSSVVMITSFPTDSITPSKTVSYIGSAQTLYMSKNTMAVSYARSRWNPLVVEEEVQIDVKRESDAEGLKEKIAPAPQEEPIDPFRIETVIKRFSVDGSDINYLAENRIAGTLINQFALDEHNGVLRVAYTDHSSEETSVDTFDKNMNQLGSLSKLAKGERIYSVRFMGEKLYLVTFKQVDPFFVIDVKDPAEPKVLGYLKIPGYSSYLHPLDKNHILGIGNDTEFDGTFVRNSGVKISVFDVKDVKNPKQISNVVLGKGGSYTPVSDDHKAFLYNGNKKYFGFPITLTDEIAKSNGKEKWIENRTVFDGACVYAVDPNFKLKLKGNISHYKNGEGQEYEYQNRIQRLLYIDDIIYTISENKITSTNENTMKTVDTVELNSR